jgi:hypothetical protein
MIGLQSTLAEFASLIWRFALALNTRGIKSSSCPNPALAQHIDSFFAQYVLIREVLQCPAKVVRGWWLCKFGRFQK